MAINVSSKGGNFELPPEGNHLACCYSIIDLGTQHEKDFKGKETMRRKILFSFELCHEKRKFKDDEPEKPFSVSQRYTATLSDKSNLYRDLKAWRGRDFTPEEKEKFDISIFLGKYCMIQVSHNNGYANIQNIASVPKGIEKTPRVNPMFEFSTEDMSEEKFSLLPEFAKKIVEQSQEYKERKGQAQEVLNENTEDDTVF